MTPYGNGSATDRPVNTYHSLGLLNPTARPTNHRVPGVLFNQSLRQRQQHAKDLQQIRQDLSASARLQAAVHQTAQQLADHVDRLADAIVEWGWRTVDGLPRLPVPGPTLVGAASTRQEPPKDLLGKNAVVLLRCPIPSDVPEPEAFDVDRYAEAAASVVGQDKVHVVDGGDCHYRFARSLAVQTPNGVVLNKPIYGDSELSSINALADFFLQSGYPVEFLEIGPPGEAGIDFANVLWLPQHDMLILAESGDVRRFPPIALPELVNAFNKPAHVLHVNIRLDGAVVALPNGLKDPLCYPLPMFFHTLQNTKGQWLVLIAEKCVNAVHRLYQDGSVQREASLTQVMQDRSHTVVSLSPQDLEALSACGFSSTLKKGVYLVNRKLPKQLHQRLQSEGIRVKLAKPALGSTNPVNGLFGIDSLVMQLHARWTMPMNGIESPQHGGVGPGDADMDERTEL